MTRFFKLPGIFVLTLVPLLPALAQNASSAPTLDEGDLPVTIVVLQDVEMIAMQENAATPEAAGIAARYSMATLGLRKDQQFQMINIHLEGGCEILFEEQRYNLASCPWLPGFRDNRVDIFMVIKNL